MAPETKTTVVKVKSGNQEGSSKGKADSSLIKKKIESSTKLSTDSKQKIVAVVAKSEVKSKTASGSSKRRSTTSITKVKEKKVYSLAGQKFDPPEEREPLRIFYESLSKQIPKSEMAEFWMMEHGLLAADKAKKAYEKKLRRQKEIRMGTPLIKLPSKPESSRKPQQSSKNSDVKAKKRIFDESDDDDEFVLSPKKRKV